ncbi:MAG: hypothetical protein HRT35_13200 [Algicola sp.]|nr:hypothetical protein [Algicola sp.]
MKLLVKLFDLLASKGQNLGQQIASKVTNAFAGFKEKRKADNQIEDEPKDFAFTDEEYVKQLSDNTSQFYQQANEDLAVERQETEAEIERFTITFANLTEQAQPQDVNYKPHTTDQNEVTIANYKTDFIVHQNQLHALMDESATQATNQHQQLERNINEMTDEFERYS